MELFAYLDPGSGSVILQIIIGGVLGVLVVAKGFLGNLFRKVTSRTKRKKKSSETPKE